ncbi:hypothetical protein pb186bvf_020271 [Paramecium bursaria]
MGNKPPKTKQEREIICNDRYDDFLLCQREYGFNDLKCRSNIYNKIRLLYEKI